MFFTTPVLVKIDYDGKRTYRTFAPKRGYAHPIIIALSHYQITAFFLTFAALKIINIKILNK